MKVKCITRDSKVWDIEKFTVDAMKSAFEHGSIIVDLNREGPCCKSAGLDMLLDQIVNASGIDPSNVTIETGNYLSSSDYKEIHYSIFDLVKSTIGNYSVAPLTNFDKTFGIFIGRSNWMRLGLASHIWNNHRNRSLITFHFDRTTNFHVTNFELENFLIRHYKDRQSVFQFLDALPLHLDQNLVYPITVFDNASSWNLLNFYQQFFCEIVCETFFSGQTFFMTEKIIRPIFAKRPFLIQGPTHYLKNLQALGFQTFSNWWDEGYDQDPPDARYSTFKYNIDYIASQSQDTIKQWYLEMQPVLEHNYNVLQTLTDQQILSTCFEKP